MEKDLTLNSKILVVDDSSFVLESIKKILAPKYKLQLALSAEDAYLLLEISNPDLILLDIEMPKIDGYEFLEKVKNTAKWQNIPVIFLTGVDDREKEELALNMGAVDYILKPIMPGVLMTRIKMHLELKLYQKKLEDLVVLRTEQLLIAQDQLRATLELANESSRAKSVFLANMSHEIRTPLNNIIGFSELALEYVISPKTKDYLQKINTSASGLVNIINNVLDISKIESGKLSLENIPFNLNDLFKTCQALNQLKAFEKGLTIFCYAEPVGKKLLGDPTKLSQVFLNLLSNAIKFTHDGMIKMLATVLTESENKITVSFEIQDSGIGMTAEQIEKVFEPFVQADNSMTRKYGGTGLGLTIAKNILELMGSELTVESIPGVGSKFSFTLTFDTIDAEIEGALNESLPPALEKPIFGGDILVCEDNLVHQQVIADHLAGVGLSAVITCNGQEAVNAVKNRLDNSAKPFDLIFMDIHMPLMDGFETAEQLVKLGNTSPIVALTANIMSNDKELYKNAGMQGYLAKPFTRQELWHCLRCHLTPIIEKTVTSREQREFEQTLRQKVLVNFVEDNQKIFKKIQLALKAGDLKTVHRLVHTLKNSAALIEKSALQEAAYTIERSLKNGKDITKQELKTLDAELKAVLAELGARFQDPAPIPDVKEPALPEFWEVLQKLEPMLKAGDLNCLDYTGKLKKFPQTDLLIKQIEQFKFTSARKTVLEIKRKLGRELNGK